MTAARMEIQALKKQRPRSRLVAFTRVALPLLILYSWISGDVAPGSLFEARRLSNLERFLTTELYPFPLRDQPFEWSAFWGWVSGIFREHGREATEATLALSVLAICLAGMWALCFSPLGARNLSTCTPFEEKPHAANARCHLFWRLVTTLVRSLFIALRAIPEYIWAFLLLAILGPNAWPAVLALAIHNAGILGKLGSETIENLSPTPLRALRQLGARRAQITTFAVLPLSLGRFLLYFFYRFETCVREATVLGMLGVVSLGYWIAEARARHFYDEMVLLVSLGAALVIVGDVVSSLARALVRRAA